jgi:hypothetical protein
MPANIITYEDLQVFKRELLLEIRNLLAQHAQRDSSLHKKWLRGNEVRRLLSISNGTLHNMRTNGILPYTKVGQIMYYDYDDIRRILEKNKQADFDSLLETLVKTKPGKNNL